MATKVTVQKEAFADSLAMVGREWDRIPTYPFSRM